MISIIIPVYNSEKYLSTCLDSIFNSTFQDFELILVDDGSTDKSSMICDDYAARDARCKVIHKSNAGVAEARNDGLKNAKGEYIAFMDNDDVIHPMMLELLHKAILSGDYDFSVILYKKVNNDEYKQMITEDVSNTLPHKEVFQKDMMREMFLGNMNYNVVWNKLYKRDLVSGIYFTNTACDDMEWSSRIYLKAQKAIMVEKVLYYWIQHGTNVSLSGFSSDYYIDRMNSYYVTYNNIPESEKSYRDWCLERMLKVILITRCNNKGTDSYERTNKLAKEIIGKVKDDFRHSDIDTLQKWSLGLFLKCPGLYRLFIKVCSSWIPGNLYRRIKSILRMKS